jgi:tyrosyl-tRNA synthetase
MGFLFRSALSARHVTKRLSAPRRAYHFDRPLLAELEARGLVAQVTAPDRLSAVLEKERQVAYAGVDPTARMLHAGHLLPLLVLLHLQVRGHRVLALVGGATALVGDPSGRATERDRAAAGGVAENAVYLKAALQRFFTRARAYAHTRLQHSHKNVYDEQVLDNATWTSDIRLIDFLRDVGVHARMNTMLNRERRASHCLTRG